MLTQPSTGDPALTLIAMMKDPETYEARLKELIASEDSANQAINEAAKALGALTAKEDDLAAREKACDQRDKDHKVRTDSQNTAQTKLNADQNRHREQMSDDRGHSADRTRNLSIRETNIGNRERSVKVRENELDNKEAKMRGELTSLGQNLEKAAKSFLRKLS